MNTEDLGNSKILNLLFKPAGMMMGSRLRGWLMNPVKTLQGAGIEPGQTVLEVGCGTGFFTIPAAKLIGDEGSLVAMDPSSGFIEHVTKKVHNGKTRCAGYRIGYRKHRQGPAVWCDPFPFVTLKSSFIRNVSRPEA
jgi:SAM-dependent methyltransferase